MTCSICHKDKQETEFNFRNLKSQTRYKHCKECQKNSRKTSYQQNRQYFLDYQKENYKTWRTNQRNFIRSFKEGKPCTDCGKTYPHYVMDFDHLPQFEKSFAIASEGFYRSEEVLLQEFAKCDLVCSNCHRSRTWNRKLNGGSRGTRTPEGR